MARLNFADGPESDGSADDSAGSVGLTGEFIAEYGGEAPVRRPSTTDPPPRRGDFDLVAVGRAASGSAVALKIRDGRTKS